MTRPDMNCKFNQLGFTTNTVGMGYRVLGAFQPRGAGSKSPID